LDIKKELLQALRAKLGLLVEKEMFEVAARMKEDIKDLEKLIFQQQQSEDDVLDYINKNPGVDIDADGGDTPKEFCENRPYGDVPQVDISSITPEAAHIMGVDLDSMRPMSPGFEKFVDSFLSDVDSTANEIINEVGMVTSRIVKVVRDLNAKPYKGNEAAYLLTQQEMQLIIPLMNQVINIIESGKVMIDEMGTISGQETLNRSSFIGSGLCQIGLKQDRAYREARALVESIQESEFRKDDTDEETGLDGEGEDL
tara:strand:- start:15349 stop:16116 length:768 start_codon:yes stop_codon:yes gene_type:complete